jgi:hypothetical protein
MAIRQDNSRNEPRPAVGEGNRLFESRPIDVRAYGHAGLRVLLDRTFRAVDGFGVAQFEAAGTSVREIVDERDSAIYLLGRVVRYDSRRAVRQRHRSAALRLLGHLRAADQSELIVEIVRSSDEPVTVRAAALDALGMLGDSATVDLVARYVDDEDERIAARALWALGRLGGHAHLADLERRLEHEKSPARYDAILEAVAALGVRLGIPVAIPERGRKRPRPRRTSEVRANSAA